MFKNSLLLLVVLTFFGLTVGKTSSLRVFPWPAPSVLKKNPRMRKGRSTERKGKRNKFCGGLLAVAGLQMQTIATDYGKNLFCPVFVGVS